ncbi:hypothetical protein [Bartonella sp. HY038]|uniref:hypothetical protein n=1 Tax=Bartonella sp. HY038 TaxID=2759660 RepID=UPI0015FD2814|nr:hypothetical protein [Bartonella sp. HY038]
MIGSEPSSLLDLCSIGGHTFGAASIAPHHQDYSAIPIGIFTHSTGKICPEYKSKFKQYYRPIDLDPLTG